MLVDANPSDSLADLPGRNAAADPQAIAFSRKSGGGWLDVSAAQFNAEVRALAKGLIAAGLNPGDRVAIMSKTRYEWTLADFAAWSAGLIPVPIYETSSAEQVTWILADSGVRAIIVETPAHSALVDSIRGEVPQLTQVWQIEAGDLDALAATGDQVSDADLDERVASLDRASVATVIYTSGTTGRPKGCELTHGNFLTLAEQATESLAVVVRANGASTLLFLPLAHVFARFIEVLAVVAQCRLGHSSDIANILDDFGSFKPTYILAVPRIFEKIYNKAEQTAQVGGKGRIFAMASATAIAYSQAKDHPRGARPLLRVRHLVFDRLVYARLRSLMGGQVHYAVSGGAPLGSRLGHFFRGIGVTVLEGYGLTETTAPATVNVPDKIKIGTVGAPLPGVTIKIADDGEILISGVGVFQQYRDNAAATADALDDGWLRTGDIGALDDDGYLSITGRKKEILVTAGGKNVAPAVLEDRLRAHPLVSQCIVVGDQKPFIGALLTLDEEMLPGWAQTKGLGELTTDAARTDNVVLQELQQAVDDANKAVSKAESIRKFVVIPGDFTEENGYLTPSLKLKRTVVTSDFADEIAELYS
ncbi:MAG: AMP-dependent synthetase/ligase [Tetrasphaera sp.]